MNTTVAIICCIAALIVGAAVSGVIFFRQGIAYRQKQAESIMGSAEKEAEKILFNKLTSESVNNTLQDILI